MLDDHAIADRGILVHRTRRIVTNTFDDLDDRPVRRRKHFATERVVILVASTVALLRLSTLPHSQKVQREALIWHIVVLVEFACAPAPEDQPAAFERKRQLRLVFFQRRFRLPRAA